MESRKIAVRTTAVAALATLTCATVFVPGALADDTAALQEYAPAASLSGEPVLSESLQNTSGRVDVFVQTTGDGALAIKEAAESSGASQSSVTRAVDNQVAQTESVTEDVQGQAEDADPQMDVLYTSSYTVPGIALSIDAEALPELANRDDVVSIQAIVPHTLSLPDGDEPNNGYSDLLTQSVNAWEQTGNTGEGVTIAVIDTGVDYTHADFGGPGTTAAYQQAVSTTNAPDASLYDSTKYLGGYDFAGTTYNADSSSSSYNPHPTPDANPIDGPGGGHGTHVAGTAAGEGVLNDGTTFDGDYTELSSEQVNTDFSVSPGSAPEAGIYALKVFGDKGGSTAVTGAALEWVGEQLAAGTDIDVLNLSLGTNYGSIDDPDNAKISALMDAGVLPVVAAGNSGDLVDVAGSPGTADRVLTVAASSSGRSMGDAVSMYAGDPNAVAPVQLASQYSQNYWSTKFDITAPVAALSEENADGCVAYSDADRATAKGHIVLLDWDDNDVACGSSTRFANATDAGAKGVLLKSQGNSFDAGIAGNSSIPGAQITGDSVATLTAAMESSPVFIRLYSAGKATLAMYDTNRVDTLASFSSRGTHGSINGVVKPDVAAPGVQITSAGRGTGNGSAAMSGTSMATPHTAGIAALVFQSHPDWTGDQVKNQIINTATHDIVVSGDNPVAYGPMRVGTGRVDALAAVQNTVLAASVENGNLVTASFGVVEVGADPVYQTRTIRLTNTGSETITYDAAYIPRVETPGVSYSLDQSQVTVPAGGTASVTITLSIPDATALRHTLDTTSVATQAGVARQYVTDASGVVEFTAVPVSTGIEDSSTAASSLRVAVAAVPKPVSQTTVSALSFANAEATEGTLDVTGTGLAQGSGSEAYNSLLVPLQLGIEDPQETFPEDSAVTTLKSLDIRAVGASSTAPQLADPSQGLLTIGIVMDGDWARISPVSYPVVSLDVNGDKRTDFYMYTTLASSGSDVPVVATVDAVTGKSVDVRPLNNMYGDVDTNVFDNNVMTMSVSLAAMGYTPGTTSSTVRYAVQTQSYYAPNYQTKGDAIVDETDTGVFDVYHPDLWFGTEGTENGAIAYQDAEGSVVAHRNAGSDAKALVLKLHGSDEERSAILTSATDEPTTPPTDEPTQEPTQEPTSSPEPTSQPTPGTDVTTPGSGSGQSTNADGGNGLPNTGARVAGIAIAALLASAAGAVMVVKRRRAAEVAD